MHYRSIWISDIHLGTKGCSVNRLKTFLKANTSDNLYLVGDIIDFWALSRTPYFPASHVDILRKFLKISSNTNVCFIVGNHDEPIRKFLPVTVGNIQVVDDLVYTGVDGKRYLVVHGDAYDQIIKYAKWVAWLGDIGYTFLLRSNLWVNRIRKLFGCSEWSLSAYVKRKVKTAANFIGKYEDAVCADILRRKLDGVICGHIHHAEIKNINGVCYMNDGDWVESCTALVEHHDGRFEIIQG